jgi:hypothetical protein
LMGESLHNNSKSYPFSSLLCFVIISQPVFYFPLV